MNTSARILIVDDEPEIRQMLREFLECAGHQVSAAENGKEMWAHLKSGAIDLVALDLNLSDEDGLELARVIKKVRNIPIVMISGRREAIDRIAGLEKGADDYIVKPFQLREVLARVKLVLERYNR